MPTDISGTSGLQFPQHPSLAAPSRQKISTGPNLREGTMNAPIAENALRCDSAGLTMIVAVTPGLFVSPALGGGLLTQPCSRCYPTTPGCGCCTPSCEPTRRNHSR